MFFKDFDLEISIFFSCESIKIEWNVEGFVNSFFNFKFKTKAFL